MFSATPIPLTATQPRTIAIYFDDQEVQRIEDGQLIHLLPVPQHRLPSLLQMFWDGELVYELCFDTVTINRLPLQAN